jgi:FkbM family methyltransferase
VTEPDDPIRIRRKLRRFVTTILDRAGVYAERRQALPRGFDWLLDVERLFSPRTPRVVLDIGANIGQTTLGIRQRFPMARVHAFEPVRSTFTTLRDSVGNLPDVHCHNFALSDQRGTRTISILPGSVFNSLSSPIWANERKALREEITLTTLDQFVDEYAVGAVDLVKTDAEGHDFRVLQGGKATLSGAGSRCVYVEITFSQANTQNSQFFEIYEFLQSLTYRFMGLYEMDFFQSNPWDESFCNALFWKP